jgi:hypothetical protein
MTEIHKEFTHLVSLIHNLPQSTHVTHGKHVDPSRHEKILSLVAHGLDDAWQQGAEYYSACAGIMCTENTLKSLELCLEHSDDRLASLGMRILGLVVARFNHERLFDTVLMHSSSMLDRIIQSLYSPSDILRFGAIQAVASLLGDERALEWLYPRIPFKLLLELVYVNNLFVIFVTRLHVLLQSSVSDSWLLGHVRRMIWTCCGSNCVS